MSVWQQPLSSLKGVGEKLQEKLQRLGLRCVEDLLFHFPLRYQDKTHIYPIGSLEAKQQALVVGEVLHSQVSFRGRRQLVMRVNDGTGAIDVRLFHFNKSQQQSLTQGTRLQLYGEARRGRAMLEMVHPEYKVLKADQPPQVEESYSPIYPTTDGLGQPSIRNLVNQALSLLKSSSVAELLPPEHGFDFALVEAIEFLHRPSLDAPLWQLEQKSHPAQHRLAYEELLAYQVSMYLLKQQHQQQQAYAFPVSSQLQQQLQQQLPFKLTAAQQRVIREVSKDLQQTHPMSRLVQGDVGSGKTLVAAMCALPVIEAGFQVALMAPTEILAEQHGQNFVSYFAALGINVKLLLGKHTAKQKRDIGESIACGEAQMVIGTHALFQDQVRFQRLGLIIIDEQHRFGVQQRLALKDKGADHVPHQLVMTATPIPRTLAMTCYADLDVSVIDELPPGRTPVTTVAVANEKRQQVIERVANACQQGRQAYWVCTLIEESEALQCQAAEVTAEELKQQLPHLVIGLVHGRMKAKEKQLEMEAFKRGDIDLLVATTVIEVGVDVPNASLMIIENPERLGLSQLHQLRGRVGRGAVESHCVLVYQAPLSQNGQQRLAVMRETNDGFKIAEEDLKLRGPGEVLGTKQTGAVEFKVADLMRDQHLLPKVQQQARELVENNMARSNALMQRWIGNRVDFGRV